MLRAATTLLTLALLARAAWSAALPQDGRGVVLRTPEACPGYTLVSPFSNTMT